MKTIKYLIAFLLLQNVGLTAQNKNEGNISYEMILNVHANLTKDQMIYKSMIPEKVKSKVNILFKDNIYKIEIITPEKTDENVFISLSSYNSNQLVNNNKQIYYTLYKKEKHTYYTENKTKSVTCIVDKKSIKKILGYNCYKVTYKSSDNETYEFWVTNDLKISCNPIEACNVAGAVLEVKSKKINYTATKVELKAQNIDKFEIPSSYIKISNEQAEDLEEELNVSN